VVGCVVVEVEFEFVDLVVGVDGVDCYFDFYVEVGCEWEYCL